LTYKTRFQVDIEARTRETLWRTYMLSSNVYDM